MQVVRITNSSYSPALPHIPTGPVPGQAPKAHRDLHIRVGAPAQVHHSEALHCSLWHQQPKLPAEEWGLYSWWGAD